MDLNLILQDKLIPTLIVHMMKKNIKNHELINELSNKENKDLEYSEKQEDTFQNFNENAFPKECNLVYIDKYNFN